MTLRIGGLFEGYSGLSMGVGRVLDAELAWYSEIDKGACKVLSHRFPGVPNVGDVTTVDWSQVEPVDVLTGGSPCQDLSHAGRRAGMTEGTRSNLWVAMREAIAQLRPGLVVWENVRGAYSAAADSALEPCPGCVGDGSGVHLRALGRVLGDLSDLGYVGGWHGLRAADVGAPHGRFRVFVVAVPDAQRGGRDGWSLIPRRQSVERAAAQGPGEGTGSLTLFPTPTTTQRGEDANRDDRPGAGPNLHNAVAVLLPTPAVNDMGEGKTVDAWDEWTAKMKAAHGNGNGHGASLAIEAQRLLPTPRTQNNENRQSEGYGGKDGNYYGLVQGLTEWGQYAPAIARWEALTRPAPPPTETGPKGNPRLSAAFSEWLMGVPAGWITDVPGVTRNEALKMAGNGVVTQQAEAAIRFLLAEPTRAGAA
jgi:DNA (cytosine-5)-methyltransferase 1